MYFKKYFLVLLQLIIAAADGASIPKTATATVYISIVRNQYTPVFDKNDYSASISDIWAVGRDLFTVNAVDGDRQVALSKDTPNAELYYYIDEKEYAYENQFFGINNDGVLYVKGDLQQADGRSQFKVSFNHFMNFYLSRKNYH
jgi:hypothetical protein